MSREDFLAQIESHLDAGRHVLLTGPRGIGKSHLLGALARQRPAVYLPGLGAKKQALLSVLQRLFEEGRLEEFAYFVDWADVLKKLRRRTVAQLLALACERLAETGASRYLLVLDGLETISERALLDVVLPLMASAQLLAAADVSTPARKRRVAVVVDKFKSLEVPPLSASEARALLWATLDRDRYPHWQLIETQVLNQAAGTPGVVVDLAQALAGSSGSLREIRALAHTAGVPRVNIAFPLAMTLIAVLFAGRYLARGLDDPTLYVLAGLGSALTYALRPYVWKMKG